MLGFRELLRRDASIRKQYEALKLQLQSSNTGGMTEYLQKKAPFIIAALRHAGLSIGE
ncbi:hypothetical protein D3C72_2529990 [compost metagenome]